MQDEEASKETNRTNVVAEPSVTDEQLIQALNEEIASSRQLNLVELLTACECLHNVHSRLDGMMMHVLTANDFSASAMQRKLARAEADIIGAMALLEGKNVDLCTTGGMKWSQQRLRA